MNWRKKRRFKEREREKERGRERERKEEGERTKKWDWCQVVKSWCLLSFLFLSPLHHSLYLPPSSPSLYSLLSPMPST
jgi:hypothetical protein